jgi:catechol 2,3-dioxygenase-like lactoylglutathione lyase family enzyme
MTRLAGPLRQIGVIVEDVDAAIRHWTQVVGVGPFVLFRNLAFDTDYRYRGESAEPPLTSIAVGHSAGLQIEIIQQHNDAPSGYRDFLSSGREGMQHVSSWFDDPAEYDAARERLLGEGLTSVHEGRAAGSTCRFAYFAGADGAWPQMEISEALTPDIKPLSDFLIRRAATWDGSEPVIDAARLPEIFAQEGAA